MAELYLSPSEHHRYLMKTIKPALSYQGVDFPTWQRMLRHRLNELIGWMPKPGGTRPRHKVLKVKDKGNYIQKRIVFRAESRADVIAYILTPKKHKGPLPVMICLQGHSPGVHISIAEPKNKADKEAIAGDRDIAVQAVRNGFMAVAIEQRTFGEREEKKQEHRAQHGCHDAAMHALMLGRTLIGERVTDVIRTLDLVLSMPGADTERVACMGNSGGGTITFFSAIMDERIKLAVPSCYFCTFADSIMSIYHCADNYIPRMLLYAEMYDLAGLIAPRHMLVVAGKHDTIFPIKGVRHAFRKAKDVFKAAGAEKKLRLHVGKEGHQFYRGAWKDILAWRDGRW